MKKKRIGELSVVEIQAICKSHKCENCPFSFKKYDCHFRVAPIHYKLSKTFLNKKVEVE